MKSFIIPLLFVAFISTSCSNNDAPIEDPEEQINDMRTRSEFTNVTLNRNQTEAIMKKLYNKTYFFSFYEILGYEPTTSVYSGSFDTYFNTFPISVRSIDCGISGTAPYGQKYGIYASHPVKYEDIYGATDVVARRYYYHTNSSNGNNDFWIVITRETSDTFEEYVYRDERR
jgi:hypothetical protein